MSKSNEAIRFAYDAGYRVSQDGETLSLNGKELSITRVKNRYKVFSIRHEGVVRAIFVHRYVAYSKFGEDAFKQECVRHADSNKENNSFDNIEIGSLSRNFQDNCEDWKKRFARAGAKTKSKLSEKQVREIKELLGNESYASLARKYGVSKGAIQQIKEGKSYAWVMT